MNISTIHRLSLTLCALIALPLLLSACADPVETDDHGMAQESDQPPPEPQFQLAPHLADPQTEIWLPGYWGMHNNQFVWVEGKIVQRPTPTAVWSSAHWVKHTYGWSFEQGHWE